MPAFATTTTPPLPITKFMKTTRLIQFFGLSLTLLSVPASADDLSLRLSRSAGGSEGFVNFVTTGSLGPSLSYTLSGSRGFGTDSVSFGGFDVDLTSNTPSSATFGGQLHGSAKINQGFTISTDPAFDGTGGTIAFSNRYSGAFALSISGPGNCNGYGYFEINGSRAGYYGNSGNLQPLPASGTLDTVQSFAFNSSGSPVNLLTNVNATAQANSGLFATHAHVKLSLRTGAIAVRDSGGNTVAFTSTSTAGTARASNLSSGSTYSGFSLANTTGHNTTLSLLDGTANGAKYVAAAFLASPNAGSGLTSVSDGVDFSGTVTDMFVLQLSFDEAAVLAAGLTDASLHMEWLDPSDGTFKDAYLGDSDGGAAHQQFVGAYLGGLEFQLGNWGVDPVSHTIWAVLDHNSEFVVGSIVPEPASAVLLGLGTLFLAARRRRSALA